MPSEVEGMCIPALNDQRIERSTAFDEKAKAATSRTGARLSVVVFSCKMVLARGIRALELGSQGFSYEPPSPSSSSTDKACLCQE